MFVCFLGRQESGENVSRFIPVIVESKLGKMGKGDKEHCESWVKNLKWLWSLR